MDMTSLTADQNAPFKSSLTKSCLIGLMLLWHHHEKQHILAKVLPVQTHWNHSKFSSGSIGKTKLWFSGLTPLVQLVQASPSHSPESKLHSDVERTPAVVRRKFSLHSPFSFQPSDRRARVSSQRLILLFYHLSLAFSSHPRQWGEAKLCKLYLETEMKGLSHTNPQFQYHDCIL
ncbi:unnamed protein product [Lepidochelys kempii]